jgi:hypothetical protein
VQDDVTFKVAYDKGDHGDHVLDDGMYGWGPCAPWQSWCLLERVGDAPRQVPIQGAFTMWAAAQLPGSAGEAGEGGNVLRSLAERWSSLSRDEKAPLLASAARLTSGAREKRRDAPAAGIDRRRKQRPSKRGGVAGRARDSDGVPAPALLESIKRKHRCNDGAMCRWLSPP